MNKKEEMEFTGYSNRYPMDVQIHTNPENISELRKN